MFVVIFIRSYLLHAIGLTFSWETLINIKEKLNKGFAGRKVALPIGLYGFEACGEVFRGRKKGDPRDHIGGGILIGRGSSIGFMPVLRYGRPKDEDQI